MRKPCWFTPFTMLAWCTVLCAVPSGCHDDTVTGDELEVRATVEVQPTGEPPVPSSPKAIVRVFRNGVAMTDATVTVDSVPLSLEPGDTYRATLTASAGDILTLEVIHADIVVTGTVVMAGEIVIDSPNMTDGPYDASQDIPVRWTASSIVPDTVQFLVTGWDTVSGEDTRIDFDGAATDAVIPGGTISSGRQEPGPTVGFWLIAINEASSLDIITAPGPPAARLAPGSHFRTTWRTPGGDFETQ